MTKVAVIGDPHLGKKNTDKIRKDRILKSQNDFFEFLNQKCIEEDISEILWTGDIFDTQNSLETPIIEYAVNLFNVKLKKYKHHIIVGNHDIFLRDSLDVSSLACIENLPNVTVYRKLKRVDINGLSILMVPFLVTEINNSFVASIEKVGKKCDVVFGHFDIIGAKMENGFISEFGLDMNTMLKNIKLTISGHYHNISKYSLDTNTIQYVGTPYQLTFGDAGQDRGFWTLDHDSNLEFIKNEVSAKFIKTDISEIDNIGDITNSFIKCTYPSNISDEDLFKITKKLEDKTPISFTTEPKQIESIEDMELESDDESNEVFSEMCDFLAVGDFLGVCAVFMEVEPPKNVKLVNELLLQIKDKVKK